MMTTKSLFMKFFAISIVIGLIFSGCTNSQPVEAPRSDTTPTIAEASPSLTIDPENATIPGEIIYSPTIHNLSIEWFIEGDKNNDGVVEARFRKVGESDWQEGMPLRRVPAGSNPSAGFNWANKHSGSIFNLEEGATYEIELALTDLDGGSTGRTISTTTRTVPAPMANAPVKSVYPDTLFPEIENVQPGDILELKPGEYPGFTLQNDGENGSPIVIRGSEGVVINGSINLDQRKFVILDGLQVNGSIHFYDSDSIAVVHCQINTDGNGIDFEGHSKNAYVADNYIQGLTVWQKIALGMNGDNHGEGIQFSGSGHVIEHNTVIGFRDNISLMEGDSEAFDQWNIDILYNDIYEAADDAIEADYCFNNCRIMSNRLTNVFMGISSQPGLGGPTYFIRNVMYNVIYEPFKLHNGSVGDVILQNTVVKSGDAIGVYTGDYFSRALFRNNLFIGGPGGMYNGYNSGNGLIASLQTADPTCSLDYDAFGTLAERFFGQIGSSLFHSLEELQGNTTEEHALQIDLSVFDLPVAYPEEPFPGYTAPDLRPRADSPLVDAAVLIPNINDQYNGKSPDIGAYEAGGHLPVYGVRGETPSEGYTPSVPAVTPTIEPVPQPTATTPGNVSLPTTENMIEDFSSPMALTNGTTFGHCDLLTMETMGNPKLTVTTDGTLEAESPNQADGFIIRSTQPLPETYQISVDIGNIQFDLLNKSDGENGMYFLAIGDEPGQPESNDWWHAHRKVLMDTDNNVWNSGGQHPVFLGYYASSDTAYFYDGSRKQWVCQWESAMNYQEGTWYTFVLEKTESEYVYRVYEKATGNLIVEASIPLEKVKGQSSPDYFVIGDPHTNYYSGSVLLDNISISNTGCLP